MKYLMKFRHKFKIFGYPQNRSQADVIKLFFLVRNKLERSSPTSSLA